MSPSCTCPRWTGSPHSYEVKAAQASVLHSDFSDKDDAVVTSDKDKASATVKSIGRTTEVLK